jgi:hypothetical protein
MVAAMNVCAGRVFQVLFDHAGIKIFAPPTLVFRLFVFTQRQLV